jgi:pullulanase/glycogen debranching enzyme
VDGEGVNFALFSENATAVELCLFGERTVLRKRTAFGSKNALISSGTCTYPRYGQDNCTATVSTACTSPKSAFDSTRQGPDRSVREGNCRQYRLVGCVVRVPDR